MNGLVIVSCGSSKRAEATQARRLYTGTNFLLTWRAAEALSPTEGILILSAKHGLIGPETVIEPYNIRMGRPGSVKLATLMRQAQTLGVANARRVFILAGAAYAAPLSRIWPQARTPLQGLKPLGYRYQVLKAIAAAADPWARP